MERFYNSDDQDEEKDPYYGSEREDEAEAEAEVIGYMDQTGILDVMHMDLAQDLAKNKLNQQLLTQTLEIAKSNWFWSFKSTIKKINEIEIIYKKLFSMLGENMEEIVKNIDKINKINDDINNNKDDEDEEEEEDEDDDVNKDNYDEDDEEDDEEDEEDEEDDEEDEEDYNTK